MQGELRLEAGPWEAQPSSPQLQPLAPASAPVPEEPFVARPQQSGPSKWAADPDRGAASSLDPWTAPLPLPAGGLLGDDESANEQIEVGSGSTEDDVWELIQQGRWLLNEGRPACTLLEGHVVGQMTFMRLHAAQAKCILHHLFRLQGLQCDDGRMYLT